MANIKRFRILDHTGDTVVEYDLDIDGTIAEMEAQFTNLLTERIPYIVDPVTKSTTIATTFDKALEAAEVIWASAITAG